MDCNFKKLANFFKVLSMSFGKFAKNWLWFILSKIINFTWYLVLGVLREFRVWSKMLIFDSSTVWDKNIKMTYHAPLNSSYHKTKISGSEKDGI